MKINNSLIEVLNTLAKIIKEWEEYPTSEYTVTMSSDERDKLYADMRAVETLAGYITNLLLDPVNNNYSHD